MEQTKERIIKSAIKLFAEKGFHETKVEDIALESGVAKGTVYLYFKSKEEIMDTCLEFIFSEVLKNYEIPNELNFSDSIRMVVEKNFKFVDENINFYRMLSKGIYSISKDAKMGRRDCERELFEKATSSMEKIILKGINEGKIKKEVYPKHLAVTFINTIISSLIMVVNSKIKGFELNENEYKEEIIKFLTGGIYEK
jgi:AcrR family transcriptional regulator